MDPISLIVEAVAPLISKFVPDATQAQQIKGAIQQALVAQQGAILDATKSVMIADAQQDDKFTKRARPTVVYWSISFTTLIAILAMFGAADPVVAALKQIPTELWYLMTAGIGLFGASRGVEKGISAAFTKGK